MGKTLIHSPISGSIHEFNNTVITSGSGGSGDPSGQGIVEVDSLPTEYVDNSKIYMQRAVVGSVVLVEIESGTISPLPSEMFISVPSIDEVTDPSYEALYLDTSTYIGYMFIDSETRLTLAEVLNMQTGGSYIDGGLAQSDDDITQSGIYFFIEGYRNIVGVPDIENNRDIYEYTEGTWRVVGSVSKEDLVGLWHFRLGEGPADVSFNPDGTISGEVYYQSYEVGTGDTIYITDLDGTWPYKYTVIEGVPSIIYASDNSLLAQKTYMLPETDLLDVEKSNWHFNNSRKDVVYRSVEIASPGQYYVSVRDADYNRVITPLSDYLKSLNLGITNVQEQVVDMIGHMPSFVTTGSNVYIYTDQETRFGYVNYQESATSEVYVLSLGEYLNRIHDNNKIFKNKGFFKNMADIEDDSYYSNYFGVYYLCDYTTLIGLPEGCEANKLYKCVDGVYWRQFGVVSIDNGDGTQTLDIICEENSDLPVSKILYNGVEINT